MTYEQSLERKGVRILLSLHGDDYLKLKGMGGTGLFSNITGTAVLFCEYPQNVMYLGEDVLSGWTLSCLAGRMNEVISVDIFSADHKVLIVKVRILYSIV